VGDGVFTSAVRMRCGGQRAEAARAGARLRRSELPPLAGSLEQCPISSGAAGALQAKQGPPGPWRGWETELLRRCRSVERSRGRGARGRAPTAAPALLAQLG